MNATKHGLRAETLIVLEEDPQVLDDRREAWRGCLLPGDDVEERLVDSAVVHTWMQDRARRAQASRINANITNYGVDQEQTTEEEVVALGRRLFKDRLGPLVTYPTGCMNIGTHQCRSATTSYAGQRDDPDVPIDLVLRLQSTLLGCEWLLAEWAKLKTILDQGQPWVQSDKLKAVRLLGKQPFDAIDDKDVAMMFLASFVLKGHRGRWDWEISMEMNSEEIDTFRKNAATRQLDSLTPSDATKAREALMEIIERVAQRLTTRAEAHRERARVMAALATDFLAFDDSLGGERLRRFELASGRGLSRSLDDLRKHRHSIVSGPLSVVSGPLSAVACEADAVIEPIATNEVTVARENVTNEATAVSEHATNEATAGRENATNEATAGRENVTNEPTAGRENVTNEPNVAQLNATNEPTAAGENLTSEPNIGPLSVVSSPLPVCSCTVDVDKPSATNEATDAHENVTNEPIVAQLNAANEPIDTYENATNEPIAACENATKEPTFRPLSVVRSPFPAVSCTVEAVDEPIAPNEPTSSLENAPNEPTAALENVTNEPTEGGRGPAASLQTVGGSRPEIDANGSVAGVVGREPDSDPDAEIEKVEARERLGDETAGRETSRAENPQRTQAADKATDIGWRTTDKAEPALLQGDVFQHQENPNRDSRRASAEQLAAERFARWRAQKLRSARGAGVIESPCPAL